MKNKVFLSALFAFFAVNAFSANLVFPLNNLVGVAQNPKITLYTQNGNAFAVGTNLVFGTLWVQPTNGVGWLANIQPLCYTAQIDGLEQVFNFCVPNDTNTYNVWNLVTNGITAPTNITALVATNEARALNFPNTNNVFYGDGSHLTGINAGIATNYSGVLSLINPLNQFAGVFTGDGSGITGITGGLSFAPQAANSIFGNGTGSLAQPGSFTNGSYIANTLTAQNFIGGGAGLAGFTANQIPSLDASKITTGVLPLGNGGTGGSNQTTAQQNIESPVWVSFATPSAPGTISPQFPPFAQPGEGWLVLYSQDLSNWNTLFPDGRLQYTNAVGVHDPSRPIITNGQIIGLHTYQGFVSGSNTSIGILTSSNWLDWGPLGTGQIQVGAFAGLTMWAPDYSPPINGTNYAFWTYQSNNVCQIRATARLDNTFTNWTASNASYLAFTNQAQNTTGPFGPPLIGVNDCFPFTVATNTVATNNASQGLTLVPTFAYCIAYNLATLQYDLYGELQTSFPAAPMSLLLTNLTSLPNGSEGGEFVQGQDGLFYFFGASGSPLNGQFFYSVSSYIGGWSTQNNCTEVPRASFGQRTIIPLYGKEKAKFMSAVAIAAKMCIPVPTTGAIADWSVARKLPGSTEQWAYTVQRDSDNAFLNIGFTPYGATDTNALMRFVGGANGAVASLNDQSGNGYAAFNSGAFSTKPKIVIAGVMQVDQNGWPTMKFDGSTTFLKTARNVPLRNGGTSLYSWVGRSWATAAYACVLESADYQQNRGFGFTDSAGTPAAVDWQPKGIIFETYGYNQPTFTAHAIGAPSSGFINATNNGVFYLIDGTAGTTQTDVAINGASISSVALNGSSAETYTNLYIGGGATTDFQDGNITEIDLFNGAPSFPQKMAMRENILNWYSIAPPAPVSTTNVVMSDFSISSGRYYKSNSLTTNAIYLGMTNGDIWEGILSNNLVTIYRTNNTMQITNRFKGQ